MSYVLEFNVIYKGKSVGEFFADLLVEDTLLLKLKSAERLTNEHSAQCLNCLKASGRTVCLLKIDNRAWRWPLQSVFQQYLDRCLGRLPHQTGFPIIELPWYPILIEEALHLGVAARGD